MRAAEKFLRQLFVFAQQAEQDVLGIDSLRSKLTGFVTGEKDDAARFLGITFEHIGFRCSVVALAVAQLSVFKVEHAVADRSQPLIVRDNDRGKTLRTVNLLE